MTSAQHRKWINSGLAWHLMDPLVYMRDKLRRYGYTVYDIGNNDHLDKAKPEDHTPYSETGWPVATPYGWVTAIDIMPPPSGKGLPSLQQLGAQIRKDKIAGRAPFVKYMNWGPVDDRHAVQDSWKPDLHRYSSSDTGHIHLSGRSDMIHSAVRYDPVAALRGVKGPSMILVGIDGQPAQYLTTGNGKKTIVSPAISDALQAAGVPLAWMDTEADLNLVVNVGAGTEQAAALDLSDVAVTGTLRFDKD